MNELSPDQRPDGWSAGASGYLVEFSPHTEPYADAMVDALTVGPDDAVLDVAAGAGAFTLAAARRGAHVVATDFAVGMVEVLAARRAAEGLPGPVEQADGTALPFDDDTFDVAGSMFGLMFFPDTAAGLRELRRVVVPGGRVGIGTWHLEEFTLQRAVRAALAEVVAGFTTPPPPVWAPLGSADGLAAALTSAGLSDVEVQSLTRSWHLDDPAGFFRSFRSWSPPIQVLMADVDPALVDAAAEVFARVVSDEGDASGGLPVTALLATAAVP